MPLRKIDEKYVKHDLKRFHQGDLIRDISLVHWAEEVGDEIEIVERNLPYSILLTQDCDLEQDFDNRSKEDRNDNDKYLDSFLLCPAYPSEKFRKGEHLEALELKMQSFNSKEWARLTKNNLYRYHYLNKNLDLQVPDLILDFKHYFTIPRYILYSDAYMVKYLATVSALFRDDLSIRFANYLSRIGLPELNKKTSEQEEKPRP